MTFLGPSGSGKTTMLSMIAGFTPLTAGSIFVDDGDISQLKPHKRNLGVVFQQYALFPHLSVRRNVAFPLEQRRIPKAEIERRVDEALALVDLVPYGDRAPKQLSGGQQQRVALARALAIAPQVLLLDEPLSALDAKVRVQLRDEIKRIQTEVGTTTLFVTHDQEEALAVADRVGVMRAGRLEQLGEPADVYLRPVNAFVADFVGLSNRLPGRVDGDSVDVLGTRLPLASPAGSGPSVTALVRPESIDVTPDPDGPGRVLTASFLGPMSRVTVALGDRTVVAQIASARMADLTPGTAVRIALRPVPVAVAGD